MMFHEDVIILGYPDEPSHFLVLDFIVKKCQSERFFDFMKKYGYIFKSIESVFVNKAIRDNPNYTHIFSFTLWRATGFERLKMIKDLSNILQNLKLENFSYKIIYAGDII